MTLPPELAGFDAFAVTPGRGDRDELLAALAGLTERGVKKLLLREKSLAPAGRRALAEALAPACRARSIELWISEDAELAAQVGAAGVHLSERSPSPARVRERLPASLGLGVSLHAPIARTAAELALCRHAFLGPLFATPDKPDAEPLGIVRFREITNGLRLPVHAIGGIGAAELPTLLDAGVRRIAAIRLFFG
jgi:thiamine-phosphate diphosphorylase